MITIPVFVLLILFAGYQRKNKYRFGPVSFLLITYVVMGLLSLVCELFPVLFVNLPIRLEPMLFLSLCFIIVFLGFWNFTDSKLIAIRIENIVIYRWLENALIVGGISSILFFLPFAISALGGNISSNRNDLVSYQVSPMAAMGLLNSICSLFANLFILAQVCGFMNLIPINGQRRTGRAYLLLVSSLSYFIYILAYVGRDGTIYWTMSFLFCFLLFRNFLSKANIHKLKRGFVVLFLIIFTPFIMISVSRFSDSPAGTGLSLISYGGQQIRNFNDHYQVKAPLLDGRFSFPVVVNLLEFVKLKEKSTYNQEDYFSYFLDDDILPWVFTTFIGTLMLDFGKIGVLVILSLLSMGVWSSTRRFAKTGIFDFSNLVMFVLLFQIVHWGVFYFRQFTANFYLIGMFLIFAVFKWFGLSRGQVWPTRLFRRV